MEAINNLKEEKIMSVSVEAILMRIQTLKVDTSRTQDMHFKVKLQLEEQLEDNEVKLHFCRGVIGACDELENFINATSKGAADIPSIRKAMDGLAMEKPEKKIEFPDTGEDIEGTISRIEEQQPREGGK